MLQPQTEYCVPTETARVAKAIFPDSNIYLTLADVLGAFLEEWDARQLISPKRATGRISIPASVGNDSTVH